MFYKKIILNFYLWNVGEFYQPHEMRFMIHCFFWNKKLCNPRPCCTWIEAKNTIYFYIPGFETLQSVLKRWSPGFSRLFSKKFTCPFQEIAYIKAHTHKKQGWTGLERANLHSVTLGSQSKSLFISRAVRHL